MQGKKQFMKMPGHSIYPMPTTAYVLLRGREVGSPANPPSAGAHWKNQPFSPFKLGGLAWGTIKLTCIAFPNQHEQNYETML